MVVGDCERGTDAAGRDQGGQAGDRHDATGTGLAEQYLDEVVSDRTQRAGRLAACCLPEAHLCPFVSAEPAGVAVGVTAQRLPRPRSAASMVRIRGVLRWGQPAVPELYRYDGCLTRPARR
jgi:hypothetical protein